MAWNRGILGGLLAVSAIAMMSAASSAQGVPPNYSWNWVTIGAPGNRGTLPSEVGYVPGLPSVGAVAQTFRMATTPVTTGQWWEFMQEYKYFISPQNAGDFGFTNTNWFGGFDPQGVPQYQPPPAAGLNGIREAGWRYMARFVNWLNNGKPDHTRATAADFERGVYDTSTFGRDANGNLTDITTPAAGAKFWIPNLDQFIKAAYYDPNKYGPGQEGYWFHPGGQDTPLRPGLPGEPGAQTSYGANINLLGHYPAAGSYPNVSAPWGLLDVSGGGGELLPGSFGNYLLGKGTPPGGFFLQENDQINRWGWVLPEDPLPFNTTFRLASIVPSPPVALLVAAYAGGLTLLRRRS